MKIGLLFPSNTQTHQKDTSFDDLLASLKELWASGAQGVIVPQGALLGPMATSFSYFPWFQTLTQDVVSLVQGLMTQETDFIITPLVKNGEFVPALISNKEVIWAENDCLMKDGVAFIVGNNASNIKSDCTKVALILQAKPFTFNHNEVSSHQAMLSTINQWSLEYQCPVFHMAMKGAYDTKVWDGVGAYQLSIHDPATLNGSSVLMIEQKHDQAFHFSDDKVPSFQTQSIEEQLEEHIVESIRSYFYRGNFKKIIVGLSGGIDSALVAVLSVLALGKEHVKAILMPGPYSSDHSIKDAQSLSIDLGIEYDISPIVDIYQQYTQSLNLNELGLIPFGLMHENLQARIRGDLLMAYSNALDGLVLNTCNKSEDAVGYSTLYGDAIGGFAPIGDLYKTEVYKLSQHLNMKYEKEMIPVLIIEKAPSAELKPNQKDSDTLPEYEELDSILRAYLDDHLSVEEISEKLNFSKEKICNIIYKIHSSEYKRRQSPPILYLTEQNKGLNRTLPLTQRIKI